MNKFIITGFILLYELFNTCSVQGGVFSIIQPDQNPLDSTKIHTLLLKAEEKLEISPSNTIQLTDQIILNTSTNKTSSGFIKALYLRAEANSALENYSLALKDYKICLAHPYFIADTNRLANLKFNIARGYDCLSDVYNAVLFYKESLQLYQVKSDLYGQAKVLQNIGIIESDNRRDDMAMKYYNQALDLYNILGNKKKQAAVLQNIGVIYSNQEKYDKTLEYYNRALKVFNSLKDLDGIASVENNIGLTYERILKFDKALVHYNNSLKNFRKINSRTGLAYIHDNIASLYRRMHKNEIAISNYRYSLQYADSVGIRDFQAFVYKELASLYEEMGHYEPAFRNYKLGSLIEDSLENVNSEKKLASIEAQFNGELKDIEIQKKEFQLHAQKHENAIYLGGIILLTILLSGLIWAYRKKSIAENLIRKHQEELEDQVQQRTNELQLEMFERKAAEEADKLKTAFLANMSHEIRTPMNAILAFSNFLKDPEISHQQRNEYVNYVNSCSISLLHLIDDILDTAKIEAKQLKISQMQCSVNSIINELNVYFQNHKKCKEGDIQLIAKPESISKNYSLVTDSIRLRQILTNLLDNAFKFTDKGKIEFGFDVLNDKLLLFVRDTGIGIPKGKADLVFERFGQVHDNSRKVYKGTGLGLSISKNLVEMLGGSMWVESVEGAGSCFYFTLPYQNMEVSELLVSDTPKVPQIINPTLSWNNYTILVAEDDDLNYKLIQIALNKTKINVCRACNGKEVLDILDEKHPHIHAVLMDIQMPILDGYETTRQLKQKHPLIPVIAQTAFAMTEDKTKCLEAGCDDYISKPLNIEELYAKLTYFLTKRQITNLSNLS